MKFALIQPEQFGRVKVTSVSDSFMADQTLQMVTRRGAVLSCISVPTVRKIDMELLARASDLPALGLLLERIRRWLCDSGEAKLEFDHLAGKYYKARCTSIGPPSFKGPSARLSVTFTCTDYRLFHAYNDQPVSGADPQSDNFTFAGKHCLNDMGCMFVLDQRTGIPKPNVNKVQISGAAGTLRYDRSELALEEGSIKGKLYFVNRTEDGTALTGAEIARRMHDVSSWLLLAGRSELVMDSDASRVVLAEIDGETSLDCEKWESGVLDLTLTTQPLAMDAQAGSVTESLSLTAGTWSDMALDAAFPRGMGYVTPLIISIQNAGGAAITDLRIRYRDRLGALRQTRMYGGGFSLPAGKMLVVDGEDLTVMCDGQSAVSGLYSGDYPSVPPDDASISLQCAAAASVRVTVTARARWV